MKMWVWLESGETNGGWQLDRGSGEGWAEGERDETSVFRRGHAGFPKKYLKKSDVRSFRKSCAKEEPT